MNKEILDSFVELMAVDLEISDEWLRKWLEIYYKIRRAKEDAENELRLLIHPTTDAAQLREAVVKAAARPSPAAEFIAAAAEPEEPPAEIQVAQDAFEPADPAEVPETPEGFEAVEVRKDAASLRGTAARKFKRDTRERLEKARKEKNLSLQSIADRATGLTINDLLGILECAAVDYKVYVRAAAALDTLNV